MKKGERVEGRGERKNRASQVSDFRELIVWQKAMLLAQEVYRLTKRFPVDERFGLTNQVRRAAVSVSSNIAEGHARMGREFSSFLSIARGSVAEVQSQILLAVALDFATDDQVAPILDLCEEIRRMTAVLMTKLNR